MSVLTDVRPDGSILFAIALENYHTGQTGFLYMHAKSCAEVVRNLIDGKLLQKDTRVAWIAPAVGVLAELDEQDNVKELIV
jgi:hypothetical protein